MKFSKIIITTSVLCTLLLTSCGKSNDDHIKPMLGLNWFAGYDEVKESMDNLTLINERNNSNENVSQKMLDYSGAQLYEINCDLTLCFTDSGLVGFNYHDIDRNQNYKQWYESLETDYGLPTEQGRGMAVWYESPLGKDTAVYLFNLQEGVQVSFYATSDSPDKNYEKDKEHEEYIIPTPEIRTPVVPVVDEPAPQTTSAPNGSAEKTTLDAELTNRYRLGENETLPDDVTYEEDEVEEAEEAATNPSGETTSAASTTAVTSSVNRRTTTVSTKNTTASSARNTGTTSTSAAATTVAATTAAPATTTKAAEVDRKITYLQTSLKFYQQPNTVRDSMSKYTQLYEYRIEEPGQPWELIMEYENVPYLSKNCDCVLCLTSLGLVGINYFDYNAGDYDYWVNQLTSIYGDPSESEYDYTAWSNVLSGNGMMYVFSLEDGVQISFFVDDEGSEIS